MSQLFIRYLPHKIPLSWDSFGLGEEEWCDKPRILKYS